MPEVPAALADATSDFTGRRWVFEKLDRWLAQGSERRLLIVGGPGTGKSTLAARLVEFTNGGQTDWPHLGTGSLAAAHFCRAQADQTLDPRRVCEQLALQLAERYSAFADALFADREATGVEVSVRGTISVGTAAAGSSASGVRIGSLNLGSLAARAVFDRFLRRPLEALCSEIDEPLVILIDSLNESLTYGGEETVVDMLRAATDDPDELPGQVRLLYTSTPDPRATDGMADITIDLDADAPRNDHDVRDYAVQRLKVTALRDAERADVADRIATEGEGNFLYARYVLDDLIAHPDRLRDLSTLELPADLADHYRSFLGRELAASRQRWDERYQPVLGVLAVARGDGLTPAQLAGALELRASEIDAVLRVVAAYLDRGRLRLYHHSFREFLTTDADFHVYPGEASERLATYFLGEHSGLWLECDDSYAIAYSPSHLVEALVDAESRRDRERLTESLRDLLTDLGYLTARTRLEHGSFAGLDADYAQGAGAVPDDVARMFETYADSLRRESHVLLGRPGDLFVQLVNRLQLTAVDGEARPSQPWLHALHPLPLEHALLRTFFHSEGAEDVVVAGVDVTPDGARAASACWDGTIALWDLPAGRLIRRWHASAEMLEGIALSPDGARVISRDFENRVVLWDAENGSELRSWVAATMAVTPDWTSVLLAGDDGTVAVRALSDGVVIGDWDTGMPVTALAVTPDGKSVVGGGSTRSALLRIWPLDGAGDPVTFEGPVPDAEADPTVPLFADEGIAALAVSEDSSVVIGGGGSGMLWAWSRSESRLLWQRQADSNAVNAVAVSRHQGLVLAGGVAGTIGAYELADGEPIARLRGHTGQIQHLALTADGATLLSGGGEGAVRVWDLGVARTGNSVQGHEAEVTTLAVSTDGRLVASGSADGSLIVSELDTGSAVASRVVGHVGGVGGLVFMADGRLVSTGEDGFVRVWEPEGLRSLGEISVPGDDEWSTGLLSLARLDANRVLAGAEDGRLVAVDLVSQDAAVLHAPGDSGVSGLAVTRDGTTAVAGLTDGSIERCALDGGGSPVEQLGTVSEARALVLTADEQYAVVGDLDGVISVISLARTDATVELRGHVNYVDALAFTADDGLLMSGGWDGTIRVWDPRSRQELGRYTWELPLAQAVATRSTGRDVIVIGDRQGALLFLTVEDVP